MALAGAMNNAFKMGIAARMPVRNAASATTVASPIAQKSSVETMDVESPAVSVPEGKHAKMGSARKRQTRVPPTVVTKNVVMMAAEPRVAHAKWVRYATRTPTSGLAPP